MTIVKQNKSSKAFKDWRKRMNFTQEKAALALELGRATVRCYDMGKRWSPSGVVLVPKVVLLACKCIELGHSPVE
jgi:predicted transcriptional regulator